MLGRLDRMLTHATQKPDTQNQPVTNICKGSNDLLRTGNASEAAAPKVTQMKAPSRWPRTNFARHLDRSEPASAWYENHRSMAKLSRQMPKKLAALRAGIANLVDENGGRCPPYVSPSPCLCASVVFFFPFFPKPFADVGPSPSTRVADSNDTRRSLAHRLRRAVRAACQAAARAARPAASATSKPDRCR